MDAQLADDIERGEMTYRREIPDDFCDKLQEKLKADPERAAELREAFAAGQAAVRAALNGDLAKGTIAIVRAKGRAYKVAFVPVPIAEAAKFTRSVPKPFIAGNKHDVTAKFIEYARPIVGDLPPCEIL